MTVLVIVESPAKAKTITKYLNSSKELTDLYGKFTVVASFGHIRDLKKKELSVNIEQDFEPCYEVIYEKAKLVKELSKKIKENDQVFLASDADLEGSAIAWHIKEQFKLKKYKRIVFNEITKNALVNAVKNAGDIDMNMVYSQQARRVLDRIVGFKLSPLLWKHYKTPGGGLSAGRVQSAVLKLVVDKEQDAQDFKSSPYWSFEGTFSKDIVEAKLYNAEDVIHKEADEVKAKTLLKCMGETFTVLQCSSKTKRVKPDLPFITSTLQQEAFNKLGSSVKRTMKLAQDLYEAGYISYHRTDSYNISIDAIEAIRGVVEQKYGQQYYDPNASSGKKGAHAQEAHECIRPTKPELLTIDISTTITKEHVKMYELIWKRTIASRMKPAVYEELEVVLVNDELNKKKWYFLGKFKKLEFQGYMIVYGAKSDTTDLKAKIKEIESSKITCKQVFCRNTWTSPPSRYNESSLIKVLDSEGIGRPSTYAAILTKLFEKHYVDKQDIPGDVKQSLHFIWTPSKATLKEKKEETTIGQEKGRIVPTEIGKTINEFLVHNFDYIVDKKFTAIMEEELDLVAAGKKKYEAAMQSFWKDFETHLSKFKDVKIKGEDKMELQNENYTFGIDGIEYVVRVTRYGPVVQHKNKEGKIIYKDLKNYLKIKGIALKDVDKEDIKFALRIPFKYENGVELCSGPYGYYMKKDGKNLKLPKQYVSKKNLPKIFNLTKSDFDQIVEFNGERKASKRGKASKQSDAPKQRKRKSV